MAKKAIVKEIKNDAQSVVIKQVKKNPLANKQGIDILENAISKNPKPINVIEPEKIPDISPEVNNDIVNDIIIEQPMPEAPILSAPEVAAGETVVNQINDVKEPILSIWADMKRTTEEDANIKDTKDVITSIDNLAEQASGVNSDMDDDANARKQGNKVKASIIVEVCDTVFMILCVILTWNFDDENQKRYTLESGRKKAIQHNLFLLYELDGKKPNPKKDIWFLILGSYAPMLIVALLVMFKNLKDKAADKKRQKVINQIDIQNANIIEDLKNNQMYAEHQNQMLLDELHELRNPKPQQFKATTNKPFNSIPNLKKDSIKKVSKTGTGRGVVSGVKRGSYKKK